MSVPAPDGAPAGRTGLRSAALPGGGTLAVRPVARGDVDQLAALYAGLDDDARYRRFFSVYRPGPEFFERMAAVGDRGGAGLVAVVPDDAGVGERIVGEAGYELLPNGDGELEITVDARWRGWLGPYLLDALVDAAATRGVPNLEADVLVTNGPMLAMLRARGYAAMPNEDWTIVRAVIGTGGTTPTWPEPHRRLRVLVEGAGGHWHAADAAGDADLEVLGCPGPVGRRAACPVLVGRPCPLAAGADAIVLARPPDDEQWRAVRAAHAELHPGVPVLVEVRAEGDTDAEDGETALLPCAAGDLVTIVERRARERADVLTLVDPA